MSLLRKGETSFGCTPSYFNNNDGGSRITTATLATQRRPQKTTTATRTSGRAVTATDVDDSDGAAPQHRQ